MSHDAIVIGAGGNGLAAAHYLARAGRRVLVLEQRQEAPPLLEEGWVPPPLVRELALDPRAVGVVEPDAWLAVALEGGGRLELWRDPVRTAESIARLSRADAARWPEFCARMQRLAGLLERLYLEPPPDIQTRDPGELLRLAGTALYARRLGRQAVVDLLRVLPMSVAELLDDWFESEALKVALGAGGVRHLRQGPRSGGTAFVMLHHHVGSPAGVFRPPLSSLRGALEAAAPSRGIEIRRGVRAAAIRVSGARATGVETDKGETVTAPLIVSGADPRATLLGLLEPGWLEPEFARAVGAIKCRGVVASVKVGLDGDPGFAALAVAPSLTAIERAYDDVKYGRMSAEPYLEARAEDGGVRVHVQYVPHALREGYWDDIRRRSLGDAVVARLAGAVPGLGTRVTGVTVTVPSDLEERLGLTEGNAYHGELTLDQILFMRPVPGWARYRTPIDGLWLCGAGTHPGGGLAGAAGRNAARVILAG